jgi:hypothetical protein
VESFGPAMVRLFQNGAANSDVLRHVFLGRLTHDEQSTFHRAGTCPEKAPQLPRELPPVNKPGRPILVPTRPKAAFQWPPDCLWLFIDHIRVGRAIVRRFQ